MTTASNPGAPASGPAVFGASVGAMSPNLHNVLGHDALFKRSRRKSIPTRSPSPSMAGMGPPGVVFQIPFSLDAPDPWLWSSGALSPTLPLVHVRSRSDSLPVVPAPVNPRGRASSVPRGPAGPSSPRGRSVGTRGGAAIWDSGDEDLPEHHHDTQQQQRTPRTPRMGAVAHGMAAMRVSSPLARPVDASFSSDEDEEDLHARLALSTVPVPAATTTPTSVLGLQPPGSAASMLAMSLATPSPPPHGMLAFDLPARMVQLPLPPSAASAAHELIRARSLSPAPTSLARLQGIPEVPAMAAAATARARTASPVVPTSAAAALALNLSATPEPAPITPPPQPNSRPSRLKSPAAKPPVQLPPHLQSPGLISSAEFDIEAAELASEMQRTRTKSPVFADAERARAAEEPNAGPSLRLENLYDACDSRPASRAATPLLETVEEETPPVQVVSRADRDRPQSPYAGASAADFVSQSAAESYAYVRARRPSDASFVRGGTASPPMPAPQATPRRVPRSRSRSVSPPMDKMEEDGDAYVPLPAPVPRRKRTTSQQQQPRPTSTSPPPPATTRRSRSPASNDENEAGGEGGAVGPRKSCHSCGSTKSAQSTWRTGWHESVTLCNQCGLRYNRNGHIHCERCNYIPTKSEAPARMCRVCNLPI
ncbi:hypothetical protein AMAG_01365 [Allomyces macrogynus ATCC 38327]|uniref:GATA-type domain-containing protein n=1 Tax=Allomyces macrogynus (strain ATCC 38327) TaxID=578462 RepID=A0A0L0RZK5_ALLM3|nr:hypothetical protein AMAG_01365 [Allomyces macrogynus ATCC 38327]|eukprot:KNE55474.1 hypothetical protein AMAG_01365 [Allomyces macrogynus ATCC 38327]